MSTEERRLSPSQVVYIPGIPLRYATLKHSLNRLPVTTRAEPERICGEARRVGYTGTHETALALYRLKIRPHCRPPTTTLPGFYIIDNGIFQDYEYWQQEHHTTP